MARRFFDVASTEETLPVYISLNPFAIDQDERNYLPDSSVLVGISESEALAAAEAGFVDIGEHYIGLQHDLVEFNEALFEDISSISSILSLITKALPYDNRAPIQSMIDGLNISQFMLRRRVDRETSAVDILKAMMKRLQGLYLLRFDDFNYDHGVYGRFIGPVVSWIERKADDKALATLKTKYSSLTADEIKTQHRAELANIQHTEFGNLRKAWTDVYIPFKDFLSISGFSNIRLGPHWGWSFEALDSIVAKLDKAIKAAAAAEEE